MNYVLIGSAVAIFVLILLLWLAITLVKDSMKIAEIMQDEKGKTRSFYTTGWEAGYQAGFSSAALAADIAGQADIAAQLRIGSKLPREG